MSLSSQLPRALPLQTWMKKQSTMAVMHALSQKGGTAKFVGGCVRDTLAGKTEPDNFDIDIATPTRPTEVLELLKQQGIKAIPTGFRHGTITAVVDNDEFEITTLRADRKTDGRHAVVEYTDDWEIDAHRRDFTINSIYCDPEGLLYDPVGGIEDLRTNTIRFIDEPEKRIQEDILRILRYFRFKALFDSSDVDPTALAACSKFAPKLKTLSGERICSELLKWLSARDPIPTLTQARDCGVLESMLMSTTIDTSIDILKRLLAYEEQCGDPDPLRRLYVICTNKAAIPDVVRRLRLSKSAGKRLKTMDSIAPKISEDLTENNACKILYACGKQIFIDGLLTASAAFPEKQPRDLIGLYDLANSWRPPIFPITGRDVLAIGVPQGPLVKQFILELEEWWLENNFKATRKEALDQLTSLAQKRHNI